MNDSVLPTFHSMRWKNALPLVNIFCTLTKNFSRSLAVRFGVVCGIGHWRHEKIRAQWTRWRKYLFSGIRNLFLLDQDLIRAFYMCMCTYVLSHSMWEWRPCPRPRWSSQLEPHSAEFWPQGHLLATLTVVFFGEGVGWWTNDGQCGVTRFFGPWVLRPLSNASHDGCGGKCLIYL